MFLTRKRSSQTSPRPRPRRNFLDDESDAVAYESISSTDNRSFNAVSPPNSPHAARLAQIALAVQQPPQPRKRNQRTTPLLSGPALARRGALPSNEPPESRSSGPAYNPHGQEWNAAPTQQYQGPAQTQSNPRMPMHASEAPPESHNLGRTYDPRGGEWNAAQAQQYQAPVQAQAPMVPTRPPEAPTQHYQAPVRTQSGFVIPTHPSERPPEVRRQRNERTTAYNVESSQGTLRVSAPVGSTEAQFFDTIAEANSVRETSHDDRTSRREGWRNRVGW